MSSPQKVVPSLALSKQRRERREADKKRQAAAERHKLELEIVQCPEEAEYRIKDANVARWIGEEFCRHFPGRGWNVEADIRNGIAKIYNQHVTAKAGWIWKLKDIRLASFSEDVRRIGGEMLERSNLSRGKFNEQEVIDLQQLRTVTAKVDLS